MVNTAINQNTFYNKIMIFFVCAVLYASECFSLHHLSLFLTASYEVGRGDTIPAASRGGTILERGNLPKIRGSKPEPNQN